MNICRKIDLSGEWHFGLYESCPAEASIVAQNLQLIDTIVLPSTVSQAGKAPATSQRSDGFLTDPRAFQGYAVYQKEVEFTPDTSRELFLTLEKTRMSTLYLNGQKIGNCDSLCTPHEYEITKFANGEKLVITLVIDNVTCPVPGGHMTSPDTQTDWLGILGQITLSERPICRLAQVRVYPNYREKKICVTGQLVGGKNLPIQGRVFQRKNWQESEEFVSFSKALTADATGTFTFTLPMEDGILWSEHTPVCYELELCYEGDTLRIPFGLREYSARDTSLYVNDTRIFLRGKHDGMLFPLTGAAPTDLASWLKVMGTAKEHGINHYRFHTCCPPEAAFQAADLLGIYLSPELPFWGTVEEEMNPAQEYLVKEGFRILDCYGNHPSFFGFSLGNELWGSQKLLDQILADYKAYDNRHLYTQGSNNFQFVPAILEHEDYFVGVRFSKERLFRGSYAMCDAPLGHIQTDAPNSSYTYDEHIRPGNTVKHHRDAMGDSAGKTMEIQYGTGVKTVTLTESQELIPQVPVVSHEIGQYFMYPDYREIDKYTGVLKAYNLEIFRERLNAAGLGHLSDDYFRASGRFAADCYKMELETALRSKELSGFQLLDLQDFTGQGTALVGILNSFMENKGIISPGEWKQFCNDRVLLGCFDSFVLESGQALQLPIKFFTYTGNPEVKPCVHVSLYEGEKLLQESTVQSAETLQDGVFDLGTCQLQIPEISSPCKMTIQLILEGSDIRNHYDLWVYPAAAPISGTILSTDWTDAKTKLKAGQKVLFLPRVAAPANPPAKDSTPDFIAGTYCTDFWNYPMFRSISESVERAWPVGTLGILADPKHPALAGFPCETYSTPQWYDIVTDAPVAILDGTGLSPVVRTIDNCERNHNMGIMWEARVESGTLFVCTSPLDLRTDSPACRQLLKSLESYILSEDFAPNTCADIRWLDRLFGTENT